MLSQVRDTLKGAVAWIFVVALILAFALWGVPELRSLAGNSAITVGDQSFSPQYVQNEFNRAVQQRRLESGGNYTPTDAINSGLHTEVVAGITTTSVLDQYTSKINLAIPRSFVRDYLRENENFRNPATGEVDETILRSILQNNNMTVATFEQRVSDALQREQLISALAADIPAPDTMAMAMLMRDQEQRQIGYLIVTDEMAGKAAEPTPTDLEQYYNDHPTQFTAPEYRVFDILVLRNSDFRNQDVPEEDLRRIYEINKPRLYDKPERRTIYQTTYETEAEAQAVAASLRQGKPFEEVATEKGLSLDAVTKENAEKGDILDPAVGEAAFAEGLEDGAVVGPVQGTFGYTVIQIAGHTPPETKTFEEVRDELESEYLDEGTRRAMFDAIEEIEQMRDGGAGLESAAETAGFEVKTVGPVDRYSFEPGGAIVDSVPGEALREVFSLEEGEETEAVELAARDGYFFASVKQIIPPALKPYEDVQDEVDAAWRQQERTQRIAATVRAIRDAVEGGQTLDEAASQYGRTPIEIVIDRRFENEAISRSFNEQIFSATKGDLVSGPAALGQAQIVADIRQIGFDLHEVGPEQQALFSQYVGYQLDQELVEAFIAALRDDYEIKVNQASLDAVFGINQ